MADGSVRDVIHWQKMQTIVNLRMQGRPVLLGAYFHAGKIGQWKDTSGVAVDAVHGFSRDGKFEIISIDEGGLAELQADEVATALTLLIIGLRCAIFSKSFF